MNVSALICTRNPRLDYFDRVLASLKRQTLPLSCWELIVVDSASDARLSESVDLSWHPSGRHVREEVEGLAAARFRAIDESRYQLLVFVDDDNLIANDYLENAIAIHDRFPDVGVFGAGRIEGQFEVEPPAAIRRHLSMLAVRSVDVSRVSDDPEDAAAIPWGAGLCVDRHIAGFYRSVAEKLAIQPVFGRQSGRLYQGDDDLFSWISAGRAKRFGVFTELRLIHLISAPRLTRRYILRLLHDHSLSSHVRDYALTGAQPPRLGVRSILRLGAHGARRGVFSMRCQWAERRGAHRAAQLLESWGTRPVALNELLAASLAAGSR